MNKYEDKPLLAHRIKNAGWYIVFICLANIVIGFWLDMEESIYLIIGFLASLAISLITFIVQFALGRFPRVKFQKDGFKYKKYFHEEYVKWEDVISAGEVLKTWRNIAYYEITVQSSEKEKKYLIEKNYNTKSCMDLLYYKAPLDERTQYESEDSRFNGRLSSIVIWCVLILFTIFYKDIPYAFYIVIGLSVVLIAAEVMAYIKKRNKYKFTKEGLAIDGKEKEYFIKWSDVDKISREKEYIGAGTSYFLKIRYIDTERTEYKTIIIPGDNRTYKKVKENSGIKIVML